MQDSFSDFVLNTVVDFLKAVVCNTICGIKCSEICEHLKFSFSFFLASQFDFYVSSASYTTGAFSKKKKIKVLIYFKMSFGLKYK